MELLVATAFDGDRICVITCTLTEYSGSLCPPDVTDEIIDDTNWELLTNKKDINESRLNVFVEAKISKTTLIDAFKSSMRNKQLPFIATVTNNNNVDHIEWIKINCIESCNLYFAAAFRYVYSENDGKLVRGCCRKIGDVPTEITEIILNYYPRQVIATRIGLKQTQMLDTHSLLAASFVTKQELAMYRPWINDIIIAQDVDEAIEVIDDDTYPDFVLPPEEA